MWLWLWSRSTSRCVDSACEGLGGMVSTHLLAKAGVLRRNPMRLATKREPHLYACRSFKDPACIIQPALRKPGQPSRIRAKRHSSLRRRQGERSTEACYASPQPKAQFHRRVSHAVREALDTWGQSSATTLVVSTSSRLPIGVIGCSGTPGKRLQPKRACKGT